MATLRDLGLQAFEVSSVGVRPVVAPPGRWIVLVDDDGTPVSALAPGTALAGGSLLSAIIVAAADLGQGTAYSSAAFAEFADASALVLIESGEVGEIAGVVSGPALRRAILRGAMRGGSGPVLPGPPAIPWISRSCGYAEGGVSCATMMSFLARPAVMPSCGNLSGLAAHQFYW
jgi:hypothetical protein